jgi:hypothetical protein
MIRTFIEEVGETIKSLTEDDLLEARVSLPIREVKKKSIEG